jgi:hypothetical protein
MSGQATKLKEMDQQFNSKVVAEQLIEFVAVRQEVGLAQDLSPATLTNMVVLDIEALEHDGRGIGTVLDIDWNSALASVERDARVDEVVRRLGRGVLDKDASVAQSIKSVETHLDREFEPSFGVTEEQWQELNIFRKVSWLLSIQVLISFRKLHLTPTCGG